MAIVDIRHGDCLELLKELPDDTVDAIVTDPPYGLGFMGKKWDSLPPGEDWAIECLRVLKPGGHLLAFGGTRTWHRLMVAIEDAGFEVRDSIAWLYGSGMPKGMNVSKAIESTIKNGKSNTRSLRKTEQDGSGEPYTMKGRNNGIMGEHRTYDRKVFSAETDEAQEWEGWNTSLRPSFEPIVVARKPLVGTVAKNVMEHGTGALNVDATRIPYQNDADQKQAEVPQPTYGVKEDGTGVTGFKSGEGRGEGKFDASKGRWPSNVVLDESQAAVVDEQSGERKSGGKVKGSEPSKTGQNGIYGTWDRVENKPHNDTGGASRFFYTAKAKKSERPSYTKKVLRVRDDLTPDQVDFVRARLQDHGVLIEEDD